MKKIVACITILLISFTLFAQTPQKKDTIRLGIYVTSIHDIEFKNQEYDINFWMWMDYTFKKTKTDSSVFQNITQILNSIEIPQAKNTEMKFVDTTSIPNHLLTKVHCVLKDNWSIANFPFDHQKLRLSIENSMYDTNKIKIIVDSSVSFYDSSVLGLKFNKTIIGWKIDSFNFRNASNNYYTKFGDTSKSASNPSVYSAAKFVIQIHRDSWTIFWKMLICMYLAFFIAFVSFFIHTEAIESRLGLSVGALFAVIGNKYIVESSLPETTTYTLVDSLHAITMFFVLLIITSNTLSLKYVKNNKPEVSKKLDRIFSWTILISYIIVNLALIFSAVIFK